MENIGAASILAALIDTCRSGQNMFRYAGESVQNTEFRRIFNIFSHQRAQFVKELQAELDRMRQPSGGHAEKVMLPGETEPLDALIQGWTSPRDEASVISECEQGDAAAVTQYQEALKSELPPEIQYVLKRQFMDIKDAYDRIRILHRAA